MNADLGSGRGQRPEGHPKVAHGKVGVLLVNLGTPDATDYWSMRRYLSEFLTDRRVVEVSPWVWYPLLFGIILNRRPQRVGRAYDKIWNHELNESYLKTYTRSQCQALGERLGEGGPVVVDWAMRYGRPSIKERIKRLKDKGCDRLLWFPLYPQYCASTTGTVNDKVFEVLSEMRWQPAIRSVPPYYDDATYIEALANSVRSHIETLGWEPDVLLASFHGIPLRYFRSGDPIIAIARKPPGYCERRWVGTRIALECRFNLALDGKNGLNLIRMKLLLIWREHR